MDYARIPVFPSSAKVVPPTAILGTPSGSGIW